MKVIRMESGVTRMDKTKNVHLCKKLKTTPIADKTKNNQIRLFEYVRRRPPDRPIARAYRYAVRGTRPTGRPRKRHFMDADE